MLKRSSLPETWDDFCQEYHFDPDTGFCHNLRSDEALPPEYEPLERIGKSLRALNSSKKLHNEVENLQMPETKIVELTYNQIVKIYSIASFVAVSYVFIEEEPRSILPKPLSTILYETARALKIRPIFTYPSCAYWNVKLKDSNIPPDLENLEVRLAFTEDPGEDWFYAVSARADIEGARIMKALFEAQKDVVEEKDLKLVSYLLEQSKNSLEFLIGNMKRLHDYMKPELFYYQLRKFMRGYDCIPEGIKFEGVSKYEKEGLSISGVSFGQSPFYQFFQNALGISYESDMMSILQQECLLGMTEANRKMLEFSKKFFNLREFIITKKDSKLQSIYNDIIENYCRLKQTHWGLISRYLIEPAKQEKLDTADLKGEAGTPVIFLKKLSDLLAKNKI